MGVERRATTIDISWFLDLERNGQLQMNPPYQRKSVWTHKDKLFFLDTVFNNFPCPAFYIQKDISSNETKYNVVDGKQRLTAIFEFYKGKLRLPDNMGDENLNGKKWTDIEKNEVYKRKFLDYVVTVEQLNAIDGNGWNDVFYRLNKNAKTLSRQELRHAQFDGWFINRAEQEVEKDKFWQLLKISTPSKARRMKDVEFVSILLLIILEGKIVGFPQSNLDSLYEKYNEIVKKDSKTEDDFFEDHSMEIYEQSENEDILSEHILATNENYVDEDTISDFEDKLSKIKNYFIRLLHQNDLLSENKIFGRKRTTHLYSIWSYVALTKETDLPSEHDLKEKMDNFFKMYEIVENTEMDGYASLLQQDAKYKMVIDYFTNSIGAATEEEQRTARLEAIKSFIL